MSDYRIEKVRRNVELVLVTGTRLTGDIFLQAFARFRAGPEEPLDVLNDHESFLALVRESGELLLVQKSQIAWLATAIPEGDDPVDAGIIGMKVTFTFTHAEDVTGSVFPDVRADRPRLVDFLNDTPLQFLPLFTADQLVIIAKKHIAYARPGS